MWDEVMRLRDHSCPLCFFAFLLSPRCRSLQGEAAACGPGLGLTPQTRWSAASGRGVGRPETQPGAIPSGSYYWTKVGPRPGRVNGNKWSIKCAHHFSKGYLRIPKRIKVKVTNN